MNAAALYRHPDRNLALELVRATEAAAIRASLFIGHGDKIGADGAAVDARIPARRLYESLGFSFVGSADLLALETPDG